MEPPSMKYLPLLRGCHGWVFGMEKGQILIPWALLVRYGQLRRIAIVWAFPSFHLSVALVRPVLPLNTELLTTH